MVAFCDVKGDGVRSSGLAAQWAALVRGVLLRGLKIARKEDMSGSRLTTKARRRE
jgi:hypothetical protein